MLSLGREIKKTKFYSLPELCYITYIDQHFYIEGGGALMAAKKAAAKKPAKKAAKKK